MVIPVIEGLRSIVSEIKDMADPGTGSEPPISPTTRRNNAETAKNLQLLAMLVAVGVGVGTGVSIPFSIAGLLAVRAIQNHIKMDEVLKPEFTQRTGIMRRIIAP